MNSNVDLREIVVERLKKHPLPKGLREDVIDIIGEGYFAQICSRIAEDEQPEKIFAESEQGANFDLASILNAVVTLAAAAKQLYDLYEKLLIQFQRKPERDVFEAKAKAAGVDDKQLVFIVYVSASMQR